MLTVEDVAAVPLFAGLASADLERLARTSADLRLNPGEFAVHEGGERAVRRAVRQDPGGQDRGRHG
ncbi:MAG TPA: hypothetical protein VN667_02630, partial [Burkholderiales bacterium]|nr:hypothetical protein [Burkholderiales bacterium]